MVPRRMTRLSNRGIVDKEHALAEQALELAIVRKKRVGFSGIGKGFYYTPSWKVINWLLRWHRTAHESQDRLKGGLISANFIELHED
jgi:hypothetical protein